ncbi:hypothetical protein GWI33_006856 [Rhynchophorus ferrugineus]|uniref:Uncharacterized protein n=1 Tax=Rhynchophorus ferrugineus TaxID=354439 RepID=A0A834II91_RHYFE|nr:hypothetical protein GWI33_006856 [Rhynchophorus ferrugineus]
MKTTLISQHILSGHKSKHSQWHWARRLSRVVGDGARLEGGANAYRLTDLSPRWPRHTLTHTQQVRRQGRAVSVSEVALFSLLVSVKRDGQTSRTAIHQ